MPVKVVSGLVIFKSKWQSSLNYGIILNAEDITYLIGLKSA